MSCVPLLSSHLSLPIVWLTLSDVKKLLAYNGFENTRRNDYYNKELGLILEDVHDENVLVNSNTLFFIDTVFYTAFQDL